jgi:hypothetical protein
MHIGETVNIFSKKGKKFVTVFLAEGDTFDSNGVGIADSYLEEFGKQIVSDQIGQTALAYPTAGHPKWATAPKELLQSGNISAIASWYKKQALPHTIGRFVSTFIKKIVETGKRRLLGTFVIDDPKYQKMWDDHKFPRWNSTSILEIEKDSKGFVTKALPIDNCSVNQPHYGIQRAGVYHVCNGGDECIAEAQQILIKQSGGLCSLCKNTSADLFTEFFDPNNPLITLQEILQSGDLTDGSNNTSTAPNNAEGVESKTLPDNTQKLIEEKTEGIEKKEEKQLEEPEKDWKAYALELESKSKTISDELKDKYVPKAMFDKLTKELRLNKVTSTLSNIRKQMPDLFKDDAEFSKKVEFYHNLKMTDEEVLELIAENIKMIAPIAKQNEKLRQSGNVTPFGIDIEAITNNLKSNNNADNNKQKVITVSDL